MATAQDGLTDLIVAGVNPSSHIAQVNKFASGIVEFVSGDTTALNGAIDAPPATQVGGGILPFFTHLTGSPNPWKEYLVLPSTIQAGDVVSITIDGATHAITLPGTFVATGTPIKYDGDRINGNIPNAELVSGAGDDLGGPIVAVNTTRLAAGQRGLVVYEHQPATAGGGKMFVLKPGQVSGIALPAFRTVATRPATGTVPGEAVLVTTSGLSFIWDGLQWNSIVPPSVVAYPTDAAVLLDTPAAGTYAFSRATGNLFVRFNDGTTGAVDQWREIGVMKYPLEAGLLADTTADGSIAYAVDTGNYYQRNGVNWQPFGVMREVEATILASTYADAAIAYATDTDRFWIHINGAWQPFGLYQDTEPNLLGTTPRDGTRAYAIDTNNGWDRVDGAWVPAGVLHDTEANILAATYRDGTIAYATDTGLQYVRVNGAWQPENIIYDTDVNILALTPQSNQMAVATDTGTVYLYEAGVWLALTPRHFADMATFIAWAPADGAQAVVDPLGLSFIRTGGGWEPKSVWNDTDAAIQARADMLAGQMAVATDTNKLYTWDGGNWIGQPFRSYATEALMDADTPPDGVVGVSGDTSVVAFRAGGAWVKANRSMMMSVQETAPAGAVTGNAWFKASTTEMRVYNGTNWVKLAVGGIDDLSDVNTTTTPPKKEEVLTWDDATKRWIPSATKKELQIGSEPTTKTDGLMWWDGVRFWVWNATPGVWVQA